MVVEATPSSRDGRRGRVDQQGHREQVRIPPVREPHPELAGRASGRAGEEPPGRACERHSIRSAIVARPNDPTGTPTHSSGGGRRGGRPRRRSPARPGRAWRRRPKPGRSPCRPAPAPRRRTPSSARCAHRRADRRRPDRPGRRKKAEINDRVGERHHRLERPRADGQHVAAVDCAAGPVPPPGQLGGEYAALGEPASDEPGQPGRGDRGVGVERVFIHGRPGV